MIRLLAIVVAALSCAGIGFLKSRALSQRVQELQMIRKILRFLKGEISYAGTPLPDAFWQIGGRMEDPYRDFLQDIAEDMRRCSGNSFAKILSDNVDCHLAATRLTEADRKELKEFGSGMGYLDRAMQLANLDHYEELLAAKTEELNLGLPVRKKLCQSLGIMGGLFLVILFL